jgi:hypothetical protein
MHPPQWATRPTAHHRTRSGSPGATPTVPASWALLDYAGPPVPPLPVQTPDGPIFPAGQPMPPVARPPAPLPAAISTGVRAKRPPKLLLLGGSLLVLVLVVVGLGLGGKVLGRSVLLQEMLVVW